MSAGPALLADIGGTNARFAARLAGVPILAILDPHPGLLGAAVHAASARA